MAMFNRIKALVIDTAMGFSADDCLSRSAAIAYYTLFSIAPLLIIAIAIAGFVFGDDAARGAVAGQLNGLIGHDAAEAVQGIIRGASDTGHGTIATIIGVVTLLFAASGTFGELRSALNAIWKAEPSQSGAISGLLRSKALALGLVATTGFLLLASLVVSAAIKAAGTWIGGIMPGTELLLQIVNFVVSIGMLTALFAAIYKVLPDRHLTWRDVLIGAFVTAVLFTIGKTAIGLYLGSSSVASSFGAAGALVIVLVWVYYSGIIFLLGAEFTRAYAGLEGSHQGAAVPAAPGRAAGSRTLEEPRGHEDPVPEPRLGPFFAGLGLVVAAIVTLRRR